LAFSSFSSSFSKNWPFPPPQSDVTKVVVAALSPMETAQQQQQHERVERAQQKGRKRRKVDSRFSHFYASPGTFEVTKGG
jgi:hypothetical protein